MARTRSLTLLATLALLGACDAVPTRATGWAPPTDAVFAKPATAASAIDAATDDPAAGDTDAAPDDDTDAPLTGDNAALASFLAGMEEAEDKADEVASAAMTATDDPATLADASRATIDAVNPSAFGPRVLSILQGTQPPRAVLSLADGREVVVAPGSMLPADGLIVLAIGTDGVQLATLSPMGDRAAVSTETLAPLYRSSAPSVHVTPAAAVP